MPSVSIYASGIAAALLAVAPFAAAQRIDSWLTTPDRQQLVQKQAALQFGHGLSAGSVIAIDDTERFQTIDGFGHALTGGSAQLIHAMSPAARHELLEDLFGNREGQRNMSYIRVTIGASDMNESVYTYDDMPAGKTDANLEHFSIAPDEAYVLPILKEIVEIHPGIKILASPWTPPNWMKDNDASKGGTLRPEFYSVYAQYLIRYLQAMAAHGIPIAAITVQNEPENPKNTPSMVFTAEQEAKFIGSALGPALHKAGMHTEIVAFDHNCDHPEYPLTVLRDSAAGSFTGGSGFHLYLGEISVLSAVHAAFPKKDVFFTEQMVIPRHGDTTLGIAEPVARIVIGATQNWSRNVLLWNLAADSQNGPHTSNGGCPICSGAITIDGNKVTRNLAYYVTAQITPFVPPGSVRVASHGADSLPHVAFITPHHKHVLLVSNTTASPVIFVIGYKRRQAEASLAAGAVGTYVW